MEMVTGSAKASEEGEHQALETSQVTKACFTAF